MSVLTKFEEWKKFLADRVEQAEEAGMSDQTISKIAFEIGEFLANKVDPKNDQQRTLKQLWDAGDEQDRKTLAKLMVKMVDSNE